MLEAKKERKKRNQYGRHSFKSPIKNEKEEKIPL